eukprot:TRINITY_DN8407_c0_g2_i1.p1 TRINITY_DN8407_c0_g2~~TRINITY_DN8407_c0_g2_i1.p1  ORF type:complete len:260 (+),score=39.52 TRINITY_DN8407_c0_g2_i1:63-782(+)
MDNTVNPAFAFPPDTGKPAKTIDLWGGAFRTSVPASYIDISDVRPVADNKEVWLEGSSSETGLILELCEAPSPVVLQSAADKVGADVSTPAGLSSALLRFHFEDICSGNDVSPDAVSVLTERDLTVADAPLLLGDRTMWPVARVKAVRFQASKYKEAATAANDVVCCAAVFRASMPPGEVTDLVVQSFGTVAMNPASSSAAEHGATAVSAGEALGVMGGALRALQAADWGKLFGPPDAA